MNRLEPDENPVEVEIRRAPAGVWDAISKDPPVVATEADADSALELLKRKLEVRHGRIAVRIVHRDPERKGPAAGR